MQQNATGDQDLQLWCRGEQVGKPRRSIHYLLEVVEQHEQVLWTQIYHQLFDEKLVANLLQPEQVSDCRDDKLRIVDGGEIDKPNTIWKGVKQLRRYLQRQASLAGASRAGEGHEAYVLLAQQRTYVCY